LLFKGLSSHVRHLKCSDSHKFISHVLKPIDIGEIKSSIQHLTLLAHILVYMERFVNEYTYLVYFLYIFFVIYILIITNDIICCIYLYFFTLWGFGNESFVN
jgi:hypothetical protein